MELEAEEMGWEAKRDKVVSERGGGRLFGERAGPGAVVMDDRDLICVRVLICDAVGFGDLERRFREKRDEHSAGRVGRSQRINCPAAPAARKSSILQHRRSSVTSVLSQCVQIPR